MVSRPPRRNAILVHGLSNVAPCSPMIVSSERRLQTDPSVISLQQIFLKPATFPEKCYQSFQQDKPSDAQRKVSFAKTWYVHEYDPQHSESLWWTKKELAELKRASLLEEIDDEDMTNRHSTAKRRNAMIYRLNSAC